MRFAEITGWGKCLPPAVLSNADLSRLVDTSDDWITTRTGIKERRISHVPTSELAAVASFQALAAAGRNPAEVDFILLATCTPDTLVPSAASNLQAKLGATGAGVLDVNAACSGFLYALVMGTQLVRAGAYHHVLVVGAERLTYWIDYTDRATCVLFGDGAGAVLVEPSDEPAGVISSELGSDGSAAGILEVPASGTNFSHLKAQQDPSAFGIRMDGPEVFRRAVAAMADSATRTLAAAGLRLEDVDLLIPHQANSRIIDATARRLGLDPARVVVNIESYGNTSAATIPIALTEALEGNRVNPGANLVMVAFGGGLSWAAAVVRWGQRTLPLQTSDAALPPFTGSALDLIQPNLDFFSGTSR